MSVVLSAQEVPTAFARIDGLLNRQRYADAYAVSDSLRKAALGRVSAVGVTNELSRTLLAATWYMEKASVAYQEDAMDSSMARFRAILPYLTAVDRPLCYLFLDSVGAALADTLVMRGIPNRQLVPFCTMPNEKRYVNSTPTMYDLVMNLAMERVSLRERAELSRQLVAWYRSMPRTRKNDALLLYNELRHLDILMQMPNVPRSRQYSICREYLGRYRCFDDEQVAQLYYTTASLYASDSNFVAALPYCDSAVARYPNSQGGVACAALRDEILSSWISHVDMLSENPAGRDVLCQVHSRNTAILYYRLVAASASGMSGETNEQRRRRLLGAKVLKEWSQLLSVGSDHKEYRHYAYIPALPSGHYTLLVSPTSDFRSPGFVAKSFSVVPAAFVQTGAFEGYMVDYLSGRPLSRQKVMLQSEDVILRKGFATVATVETDRHGYYRFDTVGITGRNGYRLMARCDGMEVLSNVDYGYCHDFCVSDENLTGSKFFLDRPIYRPGDTVQFLFMEYKTTNNRTGRTVVGDSLKIVLKDVNGQPVDSIVGSTDAFGGLSGRLVVPDRAMPGRFHIAVSQCAETGWHKTFATRWIDVEAYRQPRFAVTLSAADRRDAQGRSVQPVMGDSLAVDGVAASYSRVPIANARVSYSVRRSLLNPWWRQYYDNVWSPAVIVADGNTTTDAEGHFNIAFIAAPDSAIDLATHPCFVYEVLVDVTDINGETHSRSLSLKLGYENSFIAITTPDEVSEWKSVTYRYCDLNNNDMEGDLLLTVERLRRPDGLWLPHPVVQKGVRHTMTEEEFCRHYPLTPYGYEQTCMDLWPVEQIAYETWVRCHGGSVNSEELPALPAGVYRIRMECSGVSNSKVVVYTPRDAKKVQVGELFWADQSATKAQVGDTVTIRLGSRHRDVTAVCRLWGNRRELGRRLIRLSDNIDTIRIPISEEMLGGIEVHLYAVKEGRSKVERFVVEVPFVHKQVDVEFVSFRDRLLPGDKETWTLKLSRRASTPASKQSGSVGDSAALLVTMYDAALNAYGGGVDYALNPWVHYYSNHPKAVGFSYPYYYRQQSNLILRSQQRQATPECVFQRGRLTALDHRFFGRKQGWGRGRYAKSAAGMTKFSLMNSAAADMCVEEEAVIEDFEELPAEKADGSGSLDVSHVRTNLSTLAFFDPMLRTDADGTVRCTFTVPDLLTEWSVRGMAWTPDLAVGHVERSLVTQKQLMVQPNMPRFLREGDTAVLMARVSNLTDSDCVAAVDFAFTIPTAPQLQNCQTDSREVLLPAHGSAMVAFTVVVPVGGTVGTYRFEACAGRHRDGEQGPLPLLTNRQAVTKSVSMFANGEGSKSYALALPDSPTAQPIGITVEYAANPAWLAIQALPYLSSCANPSTIYLFNSYYAGVMGKEVAARYLELKHCAEHADTAGSPLWRNADVRQTLLSETPWLGAGNSEVQQLSQVAKFYDDAALQRQIDESLLKIGELQLPNGGWPWMPQGGSSVYVTQYILKGLGRMSDGQKHGAGVMERKALEYIDQEAYKSYVQWQDYAKKYPNSQCQPIMLDYLYTRSLYAGRSLAANHQKAYDFYYANAKKHYSEYTSLHDQAMLALVFHRRGDVQLAAKMVTRIRQKALCGEELGMYWRDNRAGVLFHQRPVEVQALLIEAFRTVAPSDTLSVALMQQWLLKQKQTTRWGSDISTLRAIQALMPASEGNFATVGSSDRIVLSGHGVGDTILTPMQHAGYVRRTYHSDTLAALSSGGRIAATVTRANKGISWGSICYQYTEQMDKVVANETGIRMQRNLYREETDGTLTEILPGGEVRLRVGDRLRIVTSFVCDRNLEYVELKHFRASGLEPVNTASGWQWTGELSYYVAVNNSHDAVYIDRLEKGRYAVESTYYVTNPGTFTLAPAVLQCLYAPEFRATSDGMSIAVQ